MPVLENSLAAFYKTSYLITIQSSNHILGHLTQESENLCSYKNLCIRVYCGFIYSDPKLGGKKTKMFFSGWMVKQTVLHSYYGILISNKKGWTVDICNNVDILRELFWMGKIPCQKVAFFVISFIWHSWNDKIIALQSRLRL